MPYNRLLCVLAILLLVPPATAKEGSIAKPRLRMVHVRDGMRGVTPGRKLDNLAKSSIYKIAKKAGVDLAAKPHPLLVQQYENGRLFYVFYKTVEGATGARNYIIQRIKRTERNWVENEQDPETTVTYQVEVFKTFAGALRRADQHHGSYGIREHEKREIVKEYTIGFAEIPNVCEGEAWPFDLSRDFEMLQPYQEEIGIYDKVKFLSKQDWSLRVVLHKDGTYQITSPELGFDAPKTLPGIERAAFVGNPASKDVVLIPGTGIEGLQVGESKEADVVRVLGAPLGVSVAKTGSRNLATSIDITTNIDPTGRLKTLITRTGFMGKTDQGIGLGAERWEVLKAYGTPFKAPRTDAHSWMYDGILFYFDGFDRVGRIVVFRRRGR
jgi:hypothetical protein